MEEINLNLAPAFTEALTKLLEGDFILPIYVVSVGANGAMLYEIYSINPEDEGLTCQVLAKFQQPGEGRNMLLPINLMFTDPKGHAARLVFETGGKPPRWIS